MIFVGNIPHEVDENEVLEVLYMQNPDLNLKSFYIKKDKITGESRGFGFMSLNYDYWDLGYEQAWCDNNQNIYLKGKKLKIEKAKPRERSTEYIRYSKPNRQI